MKQKLANAISLDKFNNKYRCTCDNLIYICDNLIHDNLTKKPDKKETYSKDPNIHTFERLYQIRIGSQELK